MCVSKMRRTFSVQAMLILTVVVGSCGTTSSAFTAATIAACSASSNLSAGGNRYLPVSP